MVKKVSFLPAFFIWGIVYAVVDLIFTLFSIKNISFYTVEGGYDITLKILTALFLQTFSLSIYFKWVFKEGIFLSFIKALSVSSFLYVFIYILLTGMYLQF
ncbi:MAG TPA: hypothetical protein DEP48_08780 [Persephonella sp.]|uniref:Putative copy number protein (ORF4) n=1 Tax=Persephonella marina (strain DSM 14350 / EX-H1) TaxID=123214 RepID=C0QTC9_PERMH|nr:MULTISPECIES: hypothetical protein [Persephonella]ACO04448.1 putative copy number protein (ORF4) [Persephonella marina EX-H1]HCB70437.1 hypothetical protein [Persephonella sp.]